ncbi:MAG: heme-binding protein [Methylocystaceae bacterium]|nr:heme-binding protein [Methylocystaceae bacterium]
MDIVVQSQRLTSNAALTSAQAAVSKGTEIGVKINVAVVDSGGHLLAFLRADGAFLPSIKIAQDKAYTSAGFFMPSATLYEAIKGEPDVLSGIGKQDRVAAFSGGLPIVSAGEVVGGIGVSGASAEQDQICAQAGVDAIGLQSNLGE